MRLKQIFTNFFNFKWYDRFMLFCSVNLQCPAVSESLIMVTLLQKFFMNYYENFLLVMLRKYDLGSIKFAIVKWFFAVFFFWCCAEVTYGYIESITYFMDIINNIITQGCRTFFGEPALPKDLHVLTYKTVNTVDTVNIVDTAKKLETGNRSYYVYTFAFIILYWGVCVARSGGC